VVVARLETSGGTDPPANMTFPLESTATESFAAPAIVTREPKLPVPGAGAGV
jgi:hypothetical protein